MWRTSFPLDGASELNYPHSAVYTTLTYEKNLSPDKKIRIEGAVTNALSQARGSDADWDYTKSTGYWYYGEFQTSGKSGFVTIDIVKAFNNKNELFYGYSYNINHYRMTDGHYFIDNYKAVDTRLSQLNSTYSTVYQGPHIGLRNSLPLTNTASLVSTLTYSPFALIEGQGWWNLRNLSFSHVGTGQIVDISLGAQLGQENRTLTIGYRYKYASLYQGWENLSSTISWDKATFIQRGPFISGKVRF